MPVMVPCALLHPLFECISVARRTKVDGPSAYRDEGTRRCQVIDLKLPEKEES
jgi:hypothetical protein